MSKEMDCCTAGPAATEMLVGQTLARRYRSWLLTPRGLTAAGLGFVVLGLVVNWSWLVAAGVAPIILSFAPAPPCARWAYVSA